MKRKIGSLAAAIVAAVLVVALPIPLARAQQFSDDDDKWVMRASRGYLRPANINWAEMEVNNSLLDLRSMQKVVMGYFRAPVQRPVGVTAAPAAALPKPAAALAPTGSLQDKALNRVVTARLVDDSMLSRTDMLSVFQQVGTDGVVSGTEFADLQRIVSNPKLYAMPEPTRALSSYIINGNPSNTTYQGSALGNLTAGSSSAKLSLLVNKWFLGLDRPVAMDPAGRIYKYATISGKLFVNGATYDDIDQGYLGDCWLLASLAETALRKPSVITNMFVNNGDGTYSVKFYNNGIASYVTVDSQLPVDSAKRLVFANNGVTLPKATTNYLWAGSSSSSLNNPNSELWVALAEKAFAQVQANWGGKNTYYSMNGNYIGLGMTWITGGAYKIGNALNFSSLVASWTAGKLIGFASKYMTRSSLVVGSHAYAMIGYDAVNRLIKLFNPWGINSRSAPGLLSLSWTSIQSYFSYYDTANV